MTSLFKRPKQATPQAPAPAPPPPARTDAEIAEAAAEQRRKYAGPASASTLLTGGLGASGGRSSAASLLGDGGRV